MMTIYFILRIIIYKIIFFFFAWYNVLIHLKLLNKLILISVDEVQNCIFIRENIINCSSIFIIKNLEK